MIELRPYDVLDGPNLAARLHPVSLQELDAVGLKPDELPAHLERRHAEGGLTSGYIDGALAFVGGSISYGGAKRATSFFFASGFDTKIALGLRKWAHAEIGRYPEAAGFVVHTYSTHPAVERLFDTIKLKRLGTKGRARVFELC